jgi:hypothetical protein
MNIFYLDNDPKLCAESHVDKHAIKMILEYCQLLSTAHRVLDGKEVVVKSKTGRNVKRWILEGELNDVLYSATHINHPSAVWCRASAANYQWLHSLLVELCREYTFRYGKIHKCQETGLVEALKQLPSRIAIRTFTEPTPAMPDACKVKDDSLQSYRNYYVMEKSRMWSWKGKVNSRKQPQWFTDMIEPLAYEYT